MMPTFESLIKANCELGMALTDALVLLRQWVEWQRGVRGFAPDGLVEDSLALIGNAPANPAKP